MINSREIIKKMIPDKLFLRIAYAKHMSAYLNLKNPRTFNEKMQWLKLYDRKDIYSKMVDKYEVKRMVSKLIGDQYIIPSYGVWDSFDEIDFDSLPESFVLKTTHDSGSVVVCKDKKTLDKKAVQEKLSKSLKRNYFWVGREWPYKNVKPRIIAEKFIEDAEHDVLPVYKFFCFGGTPRLIQVIQNDKTKDESIDYYDCEWELQDLQQNFPNSITHLGKPEKLDEMLQIVKILALDIPFVRVDLYVANEKIFFSEYTFFSDCGYERFIPDEWDMKLGEWINIPSSKKTVC